MKEVIIQKIISLICVIFAIGGGYATSLIFHPELIHFLNKFPLIKFVPVMLIAWIVLGRCGWNIQTWSGSSPEEVFDQWFFRIIYVISFILLSTFFFSENMHL